MTLAPDWTAAVHVVVGPDEHGVVRHAAQVARACGHRLERRATATDAAGIAPGPGDLVHLPFTDRLFGDRAPESAAAFAALVDPWRQRGTAVSVTLHDLPDGTGDPARDRRRRLAYRDVVRRAHGVVVNSWRELELLDALLLGDADGDPAVAPGPRSVRCIPLPMDRPSATPVAGTAFSPAGWSGAVAVLGFVFPDRGYEHTIDELPSGTDLVAFGRPAAGHDDLPAVLRERAVAGGHHLHVTGFVPDDELGAALTAAAVPVAPNRRVAASASITTWNAHGRRPLVPDSPYTRELEQRTPGCVRRYDADDPGALRAEITAALADPARTRLPDDAQPPPSLDAVAQQYRRHFAGCTVPAPVVVTTPGGATVTVLPDNRWDLLDGVAPDRPAHVSVVIPYFQAQAGLDQVLAALTLTSHPRSRVQVVVSDDGSDRPPSLARLDGSGIDGRVVRQPRDGFRAAAARNRGAAAADGDVLVFLDGDTIPEPDYLTRLTRLPALCPDALTVGRRRHADLAGWTPDAVTAWLAGNGPAPRELREPQWLRDLYTAGGDLLRVDERSYRAVISAVLATSRELFTDVGGFDEAFRGYGGEDWELTHRAYAAGAVLAHVRDAVAWHDGPDWADRPEPDRRAAKNAETLVLAQRLPDPVARGGGRWTRPAVVVELAFTDPVEVLSTARAALSGDADAGVWLVTPPGGSTQAAQKTVRQLDDPGIAVGPVPDDVRASALAVVRLSAPARVTGLMELLALAQRHGPLQLPTGSLEPTRVGARTRRWARRWGAEPELVAARLFGGRDRPGPRPSRPVDLAHELKYVGQEAAVRP